MTDDTDETKERGVLVRQSTEKTEREFKRKFLWKSCCMELDKRAVLFFSQLALSFVIILFCMTMLILNQDCSTFSRWSPVVTFMVGIWFPQPQLRES